MRRLGQHFLTNKAVISKIVAALELQNTKHEAPNTKQAVVEVGPGHGELTEEILRYPIKLIAIEKDPNLVQKLKDKFSINNYQFSIIEGDILKILPNLTWKLKIDHWKLVGNIPYYLTGFLFRIISELENKPILIVFTIQKEVAERIIAQPPKMNKLAASVQLWAEPEIIAMLPPTDFNPPPKVSSAVIKLKIKEKTGIDEEKYYKIINILFKQPRKTIKNNLKNTNLLEKLEELELTGQERPQDLTIEQIKTLSQHYQ